MFAPQRFFSWRELCTANVQGGASPGPRVVKASGCCAPGMQKFSGSHLNNQRTPLWQVGPLTTPLRDTVRPPGLICVEVVGPLWPVGVVANGHCYMASKHMNMSGGGGHLGVPTLGPLEAGWLWQCNMHVYVRHEPSPLAFTQGGIAGQAHCHPV